MLLEVLEQSVVEDVLLGQHEEALHHRPATPSVAVHAYPVD